MFDDLHKQIKPSEITCHTGGAEGADVFWEKLSIEYGISVKAYSYKTSYHTSPNKVEISDEEYKDGIIAVKKANVVLKRKFYEKYYNLLSRNWQQVKNSDIILAVGFISQDSLYVEGGTGWAIQMAIDNSKEIFVFNQKDNKWYKWSVIYKKFRLCNSKVFITSKNFAGIGTRKLSIEGKNAIKSVFTDTFS